MLCRCSCGTERAIDLTRLTHGITRSCGCAKRLVATRIAYGRWTVIGDLVPKRYKTDDAHHGTKQYVRCRCVCGVERDVQLGALEGGQSLSCGCLRAELRLKHGRTHTVEHSTWLSMRGRCLNPKSRDWPDYGGRGIRVCARWNNFSNFLADMGPRPSHEYSIDRINNDGDYEPGNCRWATDIEQANNKRSKRLITCNGETLTLTAWAKRLGINKSSLHFRLVRMPVNEALRIAHG
jgi:hypothetical protein